MVAIGGMRQGPWGRWGQFEIAHNGLNFAPLAPYGPFWGRGKTMVPFVWVCVANGLFAPQWHTHTHTQCPTTAMATWALGNSYHVLTLGFLVGLWPNLYFTVHLYFTAQTPVGSFGPIFSKNYYSPNTNSAPSTISRIQLFTNIRIFGLLGVFEYTP